MKKRGFEGNRDNSKRFKDNHRSNHSHQQNNDHGFNRVDQANYQRGSSTITNNIITTNFFPIRMLPSRAFKISSFSVTCATKTQEWVDLPDTDKRWAVEMLQIVPFKFKLFYMIKKSNGWVSNIPGMPMFDGSLIVSIEKVPPLETTIRYQRGEFIIPFNVKIEEKSSQVSTHLNVLDAKLEQAISFCLSKVFKYLKMDRMGMVEAERKIIPIESTRYAIRNGVIPSLAFLGNGLTISLTFKQKITSKFPLIDDLKYDLRQGSRHGSIAEKYKGLSIVYNNRSFVIKDIDFNLSPTSTFKKDGIDVTYVDYYKERRKINITDVNQPLILVLNKLRNQKKQVNYLIPELCYLSGIGKKDLRKIPKQAVSFKEKYITEKVADMNRGDSKDFLDLVGLQIGSALTTDFTVIEKPTVTGVSQISNDKWRPLLNEIVSKLQGKKWALVSPNGLVDEFLLSITRYKLNKPVVFDLDNQRKIEEYEKWNQTSFVFILLPNENKQVYRGMKQFFNHIGVPSQCFVCNGKWTLKLPNSLIQMSAKVGNLIWSVDKFSDVFVSVCGIDIQRKGRNFIGSISLSLNTVNTMYITIPFSGSDESSIRNNVMTGIKKGLEAFVKRNIGMPQVLILYNSGNDCVNIDELIRGFSFEPEMENTKICLISANKDSNARFNIDNQNPPIGTVVTNMSRYLTQEFYMNSCFISSNIGYSKPVRYQLLLNYTKFSFDDIIKITFRQTHLYYNWTGSVRMPACLLYAKKSIEMLDLTQDIPSEVLQGKLYFL